MTRYALYGSSYVRRLGDYCDNNIGAPGECRFFARGGMRSDSGYRELQELLDWRPDYVFIQLGGNDIAIDSSPREIYTRLACIITDMYDHGVRRVMVGEILTRGRFRPGSGLNHVCFDKQRKAVNCKLRKLLGRDFIRLPELHYPRDFDPDRIHLVVDGNLGIRKYYFRVKRLFCSCH